MCFIVGWWVLLASSLSSALSYGVASMAMDFINKAILMEYSYSMTLLIVQVCESYVFLNELSIVLSNKMLHCFMLYFIQLVIMLFMLISK